METAALFGLGQMGQGMALRLLESGHHSGVYNRTREKVALAVEMRLPFTLLSGLFIP
jgi:3-hydroxyisobutyrate dehydrogenase-like beta-hydroxyacid dehydrogenase